MAGIAVSGPLGPEEDGLTEVDEVTDSVGLPSCGEAYPFQLVQLPSARDLWFRLSPDRAWGTPTLIETLEHAANRMALLYPDIEPLLVGDLSVQLGGDLPPHKTHGDGRSADVALYTRTPPSDAVYRHGYGFPPVPPEELDLERTWTLIESLLETGNVEHLLLDATHIRHLKAWLLETGRRTPDEVARTFPPSDQPYPGGNSIVWPAPNHKEHLHVRVRCESAGG